MGILAEHMADRSDIDKQAGIKPDLMQCKISHNLHDSLELKGDTWQERKGFQQQEEPHTPGETQDTTDVRTTLQSQQDAPDVQEGAEGTERGDG